MANLSPNNKEDTLGSLNPEPQKLDAGALFVLKSKGSWLHCGYHLTTAIVGPPVLSLPFALASLGWVGGLFCLVAATLTTFYTYNLFSLVLEHHAQLGRRQLRFTDMARDILGPRWARYYVGPIQFAVCYGAVIICILLGGQSMKFIYLISKPNGTMKLYEFIVIFGVVMLVFVQIPSFHSLRHINLVSLLLCLAYCACAAAGSIYIGRSSRAPEKDYSLAGSSGANRFFGVFNAISIIATDLGNGIIPEIQATLAPPVKGKMFKGLCVCYTVVIITFFGVAIPGYWAVGNKAAASVLSNFVVQGQPSLLPNSFLVVVNAFILIQVSAIASVYLQPTNEVLERQFVDAKSGQFSARNVTQRLVFRSLSVVIATLLAAMLPFFGDALAAIGAFGILPLDFVLPAVFYNLTFKPSKHGVMFLVNAAIVLVFSLLSMFGTISAVRQIIIDASNYSLFANV